MSLARLTAALADRYRIERELGQGGMATVYLAHDLRHDRHVAVKVMRPDIAQQLAGERFLREISIAAQLSHPHILPVHDSGEREGFLFYVMPYVEGGSLRARLARDGKLGVREAAHLLGEIADALAYAHGHNVVHRDLKPDNVMLSGRHALVTDFGIARALSQVTGSPQMTTAGMVLGTPAYMAPEQAAGDPAIDHRADVYAFGIVAYECFSGQPPFSGAPQLVMAAHVTRTPEPIRQRCPDLPASLADMVMRCLAKDPGERWQSLDDALGLLEGAVTPSGGLTPTGARPAAARADPASQFIAVLPFKNMSSEPENEYFADGMTEEIINALSHVSGLSVVSRTSSFAFKGKEADVRSIGEQLSVGSVLEGSVRQAGDRIRVTAQLVNVKDGYHLWSERYDRSLKDVFAVQDEIASAITGALTQKLTGVGVARVKRAADVEAYTLYLKGLYQWNKRTNDAMRKAITLFEEALAKDPQYAPAHAGIADCYGLLGWVAFGALPPHEAFPRAEAAARRALELDDSLAEAHNTLGWTRLVYGWDWREAEKHFLRTLELNPRYALAHSWYALHLTWTDRPAEAILAAERAMALDPLSLIIYTLAGWVYYFDGQYDRSIESYRRALELAPDYVRAHLGIGWALEEQGDLDAAIEHFHLGASRAEDSPRYVAALGHAFALANRPEDARRQLSRLHELSQTMFVSPSYVASVHAGLHDVEQTFAWLEKAFDARSGALVYLWQDPQFRHLRSDARFPALLARIGFPPAVTG